MKAISAEVMSDYKLQVTFDDGVSGMIDLKDFIGTGIFAILKDQKLFSKVFTTCSSIGWNDELEIDAMAIYAEIVNKKCFVEKIERGIKDIEEGRIFEYADVKRYFSNKMP